jgi:hypothetical protein
MGNENGLKRRIARLERAGTARAVVIGGVFDLPGETPWESVDRQCREQGITRDEVSMLIVFHGRHDEEDAAFHDAGS